MVSVIRTPSFCGNLNYGRKIRAFRNFSPTPSPGVQNVSGLEAVDEASGWWTGLASTGASDTVAVSAARRRESVGVVLPIGWPIGHRTTTRVTSTLVQRVPENPVDHETATGNNLRPEAAPTVLSSNNNVSMFTTYWWWTELMSARSCKSTEFLYIYIKTVSAKYACANKETARRTDGRTDKICQVNIYK